MDETTQARRRHKPVATIRFEAEAKGRAAATEEIKRLLMNYLPKELREKLISQLGDPSIFHVTTTVSTIVAENASLKQAVAALGAEVTRLQAQEQKRVDNGRALAQALGQYLVGFLPGPVATAETQNALGGVTLVAIGTDKIKAIKAVRAVTTLGLKEAKDIVDSVQGGQQQALKVMGEGMTAESAKVFLRAEGCTVL